MQAKLNGWNSRCVATITGRSIAKEAGRRQTFDLVSHLRVERLRWVGHVLRMDDSRYVKQALAVVFGSGDSEQLHKSGSVLMDIPKCSSFSELECEVGAHGDHDEWDSRVRALKKAILRARFTR